MSFLLVTHLLKAKNKVKLKTSIFFNFYYLRIRNINFSFPSHFTIELIDFIKKIVLKDKN